MTIDEAEKLDASDILILAREKCSSFDDDNITVWHLILALANRLSNIEYQSMIKSEYDHLD